MTDASRRSGLRVGSLACRVAITGRSAGQARTLVGMDRPVLDREARRDLVIRRVLAAASLSVLLICAGFFVYGVITGSR